jgi:hypothetical protein
MTTLQETVVHGNGVDLSESIVSNDGDEDSRIQEDKSGSGTSTSYGRELSSTDTDDRRMEIIEQEEKRVRKARYVLTAATIICAVAVTIAVYFSAKKSEYQSFLNEVSSLM